MNGCPPFPPWLCCDVDPTRHTDPSVPCWTVARRLRSVERDHSAPESSGQQEASVPTMTGSEQKGSLRAGWVMNHRRAPRQRRVFNKAIPAGGAEPRAGSSSVGEPGGNPVPRPPLAPGAQPSLTATSSRLPGPRHRALGSGPWGPVGTLPLLLEDAPSSTHSEPRAWFHQGDIL